MEDLFERVCVGGMYPAEDIYRIHIYGGTVPVLVEVFDTVKEAIDAYNELKSQGNYEYMTLSFQQTLARDTRELKNGNDN